MKANRISAHLIQLTWFGVVNCYLVYEPGSGDDAPGVTLVDACVPKCAEGILEAARLFGAPIRRILLTHAHGDHIGSLDALVPLLDDPEVAISARDARLLCKDLSLDAGEPQTKIRGSLPGAQTVPTRMIGDGELCGSLRVMATPGHTPGHVAFLDERDGTLIAGDALTTFSGLRISGDPPWFFPNVGTWHTPTAIASVERLLQRTSVAGAVGIQRFAPGHGPVREGGSDLIRAALRHSAPRR
jgi:glyoxylase-like metal-dependent hydrolase (beta-lactamase superfamily II)